MCTPSPVPLHLITRATLAWTNRRLPRQSLRPTQLHPHSLPPPTCQILLSLQDQLQALLLQRVSEPCREPQQAALPPQALLRWQGGTAQGCRPLSPCCLGDTLGVQAEAAQGPPTEVHWTTREPWAAAKVSKSVAEIRREPRGAGVLTPRAGLCPLPWKPLTNTEEVKTKGRSMHPYLGQILGTQSVSVVNYLSCSLALGEHSVQVLLELLLKACGMP